MNNVILSFDFDNCECVSDGKEIWTRFWPLSTSGIGAAQPTGIIMRYLCWYRMEAKMPLDSNPRFGMLKFEQLYKFRTLSHLSSEA